MNLDITESLRVENEQFHQSETDWDWSMVRSIAAPYNFDGGILRVGVSDDGGTIYPIKQPEDYFPDGTRLSTTLAKYLAPVLGFTTEIVRVNANEAYIQISVFSGVTFPTTLQKELVKQNDKSKRFTPKVHCL